MQALELDEKMAHKGKQPSTLRRRFAGLSSLSFRVFHRRDPWQMPTSSSPSPTLPLHIPTPPPASFPSPAQVREQGELVQGDEGDSHRVWRLEWSGVKMFVKEGVDVEEGEAEMTELARTATDLPIPQVYRVEKDGDSTFIYLEALSGKMMAFLPPPIRRDVEQAIIADLRAAVARLHGVRAPPGTRVGGYSRRPLSALLADADVSPSLASAAELHAWLRRDYLRARPSSSAAYDSEIAPHMDDSAPLVLVHGDLRGANLLAHEGRLSGTIDFGRAGWYPAWVEGFAPALEMMTEIPMRAELRIAQVVLGERVVKKEQDQWLRTASGGWRSERTTE
ncbi:hypothetical protein JCM10213_006867 [Rhodosporidiobolus nylandii]